MLGPSVARSPPAWTTVGQAGPAQRTPDLKSLVQPVVDRSGWRAGNALALIVTVSGTGKRTAESYDACLRRRDAAKRLSADEALAEDARALVLAALLGEQDLAGVLGGPAGVALASGHGMPSGAGDPGSERVPARAYLGEISVEGWTARTLVLSGS